MFDSDPLQYHDWINTFKATVDSNRSITDTHRITYLQNSVTGPAKDLIKGYSYNPTFYAAALADIEKRFGDADYVVASYITKLETFTQSPLHDAKSITAYNTFIKEFTRIFSDLGFSSELTSSTVLRLAKDKLPKQLLVKWTEYTIQNAIAKPSLLHFQIWLELQTAVYDKLNLPSSSKTYASSFKPKSDSGDSSSRDTNRNSTTQRKHPPSCPFCNLEHYASSCPKYRDATPKQRFNFVRNHNFCLNCLGKDHMKSSCPSKNRCSKHDCSELHHTTLHEAFNQPHTRSQPDQESNWNTSNATRGTEPNRQRPIRSPPTDPPTRPSQFNATALNRKTEKFPEDLFSVLQIVPVSVINDGKVFDTYALIDPGSTGTYILDHITKILNLKTSETFDLDVQFLSISRSISVSSTHFLLAPYADHEKTFPVPSNVFSTPSINLPPADTKELNEICQQFPQLRHIKFPDIDNGKIGILLGTASVQFTHALEWIHGAPNCPAGVRTELGWTIAGEFTHPKKKKLTSRCHQVFFASHSPSPEIQPSTDVLENYWTIEKAGCEPAIDKKVSLEDKEALRILNETCRHIGERYEIGLPWKSSATLPNNYFAAVSQARSLEKRLKDKPITLQKYKEILAKDLALNYVEPVTKQHPPPDKIWYLPTHPVENPNKPGKIRRVANAASKFKGCSLNTCLLTGPDLLADLLELILRFREHAIGVLADIESMFMQIAIRKEDQSALRFVWLEDNLFR